MPYSSDRERAPSNDSPEPTCKLSSDNPSRDYGVKAYPTFIVADKYGNEFFRVESKKPTGRELETFCDGVAKKVEDTTKKLQKLLDAANKSWSSKDRKSALSATLKTFKEGYFGYDQVECFKRLYGELLEDARAEIGRLSETGDVNALKALKSQLKGTEAEKELDETNSANAGK